jgi:hypothetical protein
MANILQDVQTYNDSNLGFLLNSYAFLNISNSKFKDFDRIEKQLGDTVGFDLPPRFTTTGSLVVSFQDVEQRVETLTVDQQESVAYNFTAQEFIFNARDYMDKFGKSAMAELGTKVEANVATVCETAPFRFYGDGVTPISSYSQLANALALFRNFGAAKDNTVSVLDDLSFPRVVNSGLNQFVLDRNERDAMSWEIGRFSNCDWYQSNLLPTHTAGSEGINGSTLTVVSTTTNAAGAVTAITFSGTNAASDADSVKQYDSFQFSDGVSGQADARFLTFIGHEQSQNPVQFRATADAASTAGSQVTVSIYPPLQANAGKDQNINRAITAGMQATVLPSHRCGLIMAGNPLYLAMPRLPDEAPFPTARSTDPASGCSLRTYFGSQFGQNSRGMVHDVIWGKTLVPEYAMKIALPL